ncbi:MAG: DUF1080 domain-containing protein [Verrucomicrobia bacterium]|nr:DUF1080 domain-containing protein [Verrucomicrobiota bacterium]
MHSLRYFLGCLVFASSSLTPLFAADGKFVPLFNGKDLSGWVNVDCAPSTWSVRDGMIFCTGVPTGVLRTTRHYENFILELDWKHLHKGGNSGLFIHSAPVTARGEPFTKAIEVQVLDGDDPKGLWTGHGDVFAIHGATMVPDRPHPGGWMRCLPSERRSHPAGEWNHYRVESRDGRLTLAVNGKIVSGATKCNPRKGYICLESEGGEIYFRNLRIQELPSSHPPANEVAEMNQDFVSLYTGVDLSGWQSAPGHRGHWTPKDWILDYDGQSEAADKNLWSTKEFGDFVLIADWRFTAKPVTKSVPLILANGDYATNADGSRKMVEVPDAGDSGIYVRGSTNAEVNIWNWPVGSGEVYHYRVNQSLSPAIRAGVTPRLKADAPLGEWNRFVITMRGDRLSVELNGKLVIENAQLPGIPARGPIGLQHHGFPIQFANLYIKELN